VIVAVLSCALVGFRRACVAGDRDIRRDLIRLVENAVVPGVTTRLGSKRHFVAPV